MQIEINTNAPRHVCDARRVGAWVTFRCPHCDYVRVMNCYTNETKIIEQGNTNALHEGMSYPTGIDPNQNLN